MVVLYVSFAFAACRPTLAIVFYNSALMDECVHIVVFVHLVVLYVS